MDMTARPYRSVLYIPASKPRPLEKAKTMAVDAIIFDLEDAVAVEEKDNARTLLAGALAEGGYGHRMRIVRINALDTAWGPNDARAVSKMDADAVLLPKVADPADLDALAELKKKGVKLGSPILKRGERIPGSGLHTDRARAVCIEKADTHARDMLPIIEEIKRQGATSLREIAAMLNDSGYTTPRGKAWQATSVNRILKRGSIQTR